MGTITIIGNLQIDDLFVWCWEKWRVVEKPPVSPWMDSVWSVWEIGTITVNRLIMGNNIICLFLAGVRKRSYGCGESEVAVKTAPCVRTGTITTILLP